MKILHVTDNFNAVTGHFVNMGPKMLKKRGHEVEVYSSTAIFNKIKPGDKNYPSKIKRFRGKIFFNRINIFPGLIPYLLLQRKPDIIHGYVFGHFSTFVLACLKKIKGYKLVVEADFNETEKRPSLLKSIYVYFYRKFPAKMADIITTFTSAQKEDLSRRWRIDKKKIKVLPIGIDYKRFASNPKTNLRKKLGLENKFIVLNISRILPQKNIDLFLDITKSIKDENIVFVHIGHVVDEKYNKTIKERIKTNNLEKKVIFIDHVSDQLLPEYYKMADAYLQTSHTESFGISLIEAMASGLPILTTLVGVAADVIKNYETGFLINNKESGVERIKLLKKDTKLRNKISVNARKTAKEYDWEKIIDKLEIIYNEMWR